MKAAAPPQTGRGRDIAPAFPRRRRDTGNWGSGGRYGEGCVAVMDGSAGAALLRCCLISCCLVFQSDQNCRLGVMFATFTRCGKRFSTPVISPPPARPRCHLALSPHRLLPAAPHRRGNKRAANRHCCIRLKTKRQETRFRPVGGKRPPKLNRLQRR